MEIGSKCRDQKCIFAIWEIMILFFSFSNYMLEKVWLQTSIYFENLITGLHIIYTLDTHVKFCVNRMLFIL